MRPQIVVLSLLPFLAPGSNPVQNSSFELGLSGVGTINYHKKSGAENWKSIKAEIDSTTAAHGKNSLKLIMPEKGMECEFSLPEISTPGAGKYTISMYLKDTGSGKIHHFHVSESRPPRKSASSAFPRALRRRQLENQAEIRQCHNRMETLFRNLGIRRERHSLHPEPDP